MRAFRKARINAPALSAMFKQIIVNSRPEAAAS
jgi:hypothetical protein